LLAFYFNKNTLPISAIKKTLQMGSNPTYFEYALKYHDGVGKYLMTIVG